MSKPYCVLSKKEMELMQIFWEEGYPLGRAEICDLAAQRECSWKPNSIHILLNSLLEKGMLEVAGYFLNNRKLGRTFEALVTPKAYYLNLVRGAVRYALDNEISPSAIRTALVAELKNGKEPPEKP